MPHDVPKTDHLPDWYRTALEGPVITDADDVLLDWLMGGFKPFAEKELGCELDPEGPKDWDLSKWLGLASTEAYRDLVKTFNASPDFGRISPFPDAVVALTAAHSAGREIHVVTACSSDPVAIGRREANLVEAFGDIFTSITCMPLGQSKKPYLQDLHDRIGPSIYVEDNHGHALGSLEAGHAAFLIRRPHNLPLEAGCTARHLTWVDGWEEISAFAGF